MKLLRSRAKRPVLVLAACLVVGVASYGALFLQRVAASGTAKLEVSSDDLYYVDSATIAQSLGLWPLDVSMLMAANRLQLTNLGRPVATLPASGYSGLYFYGRASDSRYTDTNVYWLKVGSGPQMAEISGKAAPGEPGGSFTEQVHAEKNNPKTDMLFLLKDPGADYLAWGLVVADTAGKLGSCKECREQFDVPSAGATRAGPATLTAHLQGGTALATSVDHDHHVLLDLNGTRIGEATWSGETPYDLKATFDGALLRDGVNTVQVTGVLDPGVPSSAFFVNSFDLTYQRSYQAVNGRMLARSGAGAPITIDGFASPNLLLFDVTDPTAPQAITGATVDAKDGSYRLTFKPAGPARLYLALPRDSAKVSAPLSERASKLKSTAVGADYLVITVPKLMAAAAELAAYRQSQGLLSRVVDVTDVYDEFGSGIAGPEAIRAFLAYAYQHWKPAPRYVLLVGDDSFEYRTLGTGDNLLPTLLASTASGLSPSDNLYGDVAGDDGVPRMAVGRLPVTSDAEVLAYLDKVKSFESASGDWLRRVLLLSDAATGQLDFPADSETVADMLPAAYDVRKVYLSQHSPAEARALADSTIRAGVSLVNYVGHGTTDRLAATGLLTLDDVSKGAVDGAPSPVFTPMTCLVNQFDTPGLQNLGESLVTRKGGGATAVWGPTGQPFDDEAVKLDQDFVQAAFGSRPNRLGDDMTSAMRAYAEGGGQRWILNLYELLGDPALELR